MIPGPELLEALRGLVEAESPSADPAALAACAEVVAELGRRWLGVDPERIELGGVTHLRWRLGERPRVGLVGHYDTVWPVGTLAGRPFAVAAGRATGPGVFDMKAGLVQGLAAIAALGRPAVEILVTGDEETGSLGSRTLIEDLARRVGAVLVLEPSADGALKTSRKGTGMLTLSVTGRPAHAGLEPERGLNAISEMARALPLIEALADPGSGTTVTPTMLSAGTASNVVPELARLEVDFRGWTLAELRRVDRQARALAPGPGFRWEWSGGINRGALEGPASAGLFELAAGVAEEVGLGVISGVGVGGGSDGNLTAALGTPTLDGLGAVGGGAHATDEWVEVAAMAPRAALLAGIVSRLLAAPPPDEDG